MSALWNGASKLLLTVLEFFYGITGSFGIAIVLLTILVRIVLYPLNQKQMVSMQQMQKIQPRLQTIQKKYANDKEKLSQETMRLYKEYHVNPAAGCLPILVQLPILILLFNVLRTYDFAGTSFIGILLGSSTTAGLAQALNVPATADGTYRLMPVLHAIFTNPAGLGNVGMYLGNLLLLISISVLTWAQQKVSSSGSNPQMAMMSAIMPFFMAFICLPMPGGVMLYWALSSLMSVGQQYFVVKKAKKELEVKPTLYKNKPTSSNPQPIIREEELEEDDDEYEYVDDEDEEDDDDEYEDYEDEETEGGKK